MSCLKIPQNICDKMDNKLEVPIRKEPIPQRRLIESNRTSCLIENLKVVWYYKVVFFQSGSFS